MNDNWRSNQFFVQALKMNFHESKLLGLNLEEMEVEQSSTAIKCDIGKWPMKLGGNPRTMSFWDPILDKSVNRKDGERES